MAIERIRIDYTVYSPKHRLERGYSDTFQKAKARE